MYYSAVSYDHAVHNMVQGHIFCTIYITDSYKMIVCITLHIYKRYLVRNLFNRAIKICSTVDTLELEIEIPKYTLMSNVYPVWHHQISYLTIQNNFLQKYLLLKWKLPHVLSFRRDDVLQCLYERLQTSVSHTYLQRFQS